jgi:DmsE family decaheme c-type cytochrome
MGKSFMPITRTNVLLLATFMLAALFLAAGAGPRQASEATPQQYAGIDTCAACHEDVVKSFRDSIHGQKGFRLKSDKACETCHGPGAEHAEAGGDKTKIKSMAGLSAEDQSAVCLQCHETGKIMFWAESPHQQRGLACQTCHSVHSPASAETLLKKALEFEQCFTCHKKQAAQFWRSSHHPIREGQVTCSNCHNPHGTITDKLISAASEPEKCYECHAEKRGPFLWEHVPVREDCGNCHDPHGSNHIKLLNAKEPFLCQRCHADTRHPGTLYDQLSINSNRLFDRSCASCHSMIHGSNHPSGKYLFR